MKLEEKFWKHVGTALATNTGLGHPTEWKRSQIESFLFIEMLKKLKLHYRSNPDVKRVLKVSNPTKLSEVIPSYARFRRILQTRESNSTVIGRNVFSIYLENLTYQEYLKKHGIFEEIKIDDEPTNEEDKKANSSNSTDQLNNTTFQTLFIGGTNTIIPKVENSTLSIHNGDVYNNIDKKQKDENLDSE